MVRVIAYIRPHKLEEVKTAISNLGISGLSVSDARGRGNSPEQATVFAGQEMLIALPVRAKLEIVAQDDLKEPIIEAICDAADTGEPGDGKIFVERVLDVIRIRTEERGPSVV